MKLKVLKSKTGTFYTFWCEGCEQTHSFEVRFDGGSVFHATWEFNGDMEKPTFSPSLKYPRCHLFVRDGIIDYCNDCYHQYAGSEIPLKDF